MSSSWGDSAVPPFRIKFCGITRLEDVDASIACGADAIGINFVPQSKRFVTAIRAAEISEKIGSQCSKVGVFANANPFQVNLLAEELNLDFIQLHGHEHPQEYLRSRCPIIRAIAWKGEESLREVERWIDASVDLAAFLVDAFDPRALGGTGKTIDWKEMNPRPDALRQIPLILAGGLNPETVRNAIETARPDGVDTASGIESSAGVKSFEKMQAFVLEAKKAFQSIRLEP